MELSRMDLRAAKLCMELDCNTIFDTALYRHCPSCGSVESYPLESWLNRDHLPTLSAAALDALGADRAGCLGPASRAQWLTRLRARRAESEARLAAEPIKLHAHVPRRRAG
jgi:hypothetical protein